MGAYGLPALILFLMQHVLRPHNKRTHSGTIKGTWKTSFIYIYIDMVYKMALKVVFINFKTNSCTQSKKKVKYKNN